MLRAMSCPQYPMGTFIQNMHCLYIARFSPMKHGQIHVLNLGLGSLDNRFFLHLSNPTLLQVLGHSQLPCDPYFPKKRINLCGGIFTSIFSTKHFDILPYIIFNQGLELYELIEHFIICIY